jgi:hypothetical protein
MPRTPNRPTWLMTEAELARVVAKHFGWEGRKGGWVYDDRGVPVAHGWSELGQRMASRGWIKEGVGVNWITIPLTPRMSRISRVKGA